jgi:predicted metal-dependent enzyme (double-stranded beta helix superfamily)
MATSSSHSRAVNAPPRNLARLRNFIGNFAELIESSSDEPTVLERGSALLSDLIRHDDWLPDEYAAPDPARYQQYLLHCDSRQRFSVVSFVWGPGQLTPIHDHRVWGLVGVLRGAELNEAFARDASGALVSRGEPERLDEGVVSAVSPSIGDVHRVSNAFRDRASISIHVYGANIGAVERATYELNGQAKRFISGYANQSIPNLWDKSVAS